MESLFLDLWNRSVAAGWLVLAVLVLRLVLKKAPKSIRPCLWALVAVRLVCPHFGKSPLSLLPSAETVPQASLTRDALFVHSGLTALNSTVNEQLVDYYETAGLPAGHTRSFVLVCAAVWLAGMALLVLWALAGYLRLRRRVAEAVPEGDGVWVSDRIGSPFLLGLFRPRIYLPVGLDGGSRAYVLAHERAHIRGRDHLVKPLGLLLLAVYWFNPLMWAAYILLCRDIELACDERVVLELGEGCKKPYSAALLECSVHRGVVAACPLAFGEVGVKERVKNVLNYKRPALWVLAACIAVVVVTAVCFLTDPVTEEPGNNVSYTNLGASQPEEPEVFAAGALLFQNPSLGYRPLDGCSLNPVRYGGDTLTLTKGYPGLPVTYRLAETVTMGWDNLYDYFPLLKEAEDLCGAYLTGHDGLAITVRFYERDPSKSNNATDAPQRRVSVWTIQKETGGQRWWLCNDDGRLYALLRPDDVFPFMANGVLWTYMPGTSNILPIRFDVTGGASVWAGVDSQLSPDPRDGEWTDHLDVAEGQTVYWKPPLDQDGKPVTGAGLHYYYTCTPASMNTPLQCGETLTIRPAMDYTGLEGGVTYGVSNNWLGAASSQTHFTFLTVDAETGVLVAGAYSDSGPYAIRDGSVESVPGRIGLAVYDAETGQG